MKKNGKIAIFLLLCIPTILPAQHTLQSELNIPRAGDEIIKQQVRYKDPGRAGENVIWDFGSLESVNDEYSLTYSAPELVNDSIYIMGLDTIPAGNVKENELIIGTEHYTMYYYRLKEGRLWVLGHENPTNLLQYTNPMLSAAYPFTYKESQRENYTSRGIYSSDQLFITSGETEIQADACGMMILPSGDTLRNVLRTKTVQTFSQAISTEENDSLIQSTQVDNYKWYVHGYRYPVFETVKTEVTVDSIETGHFETAFFYPPQDHYYLEDDEENLALLETENQTETVADPWEGLYHNIYPNPASVIVNVELYLPRAAEVELQLRTQTGFLMLNEHKGHHSQGISNFQLPLSSLPVGNYILNIRLDNKLIREIILKR